jgi:hypothetical protein
MVMLLFIYCEYGGMAFVFDMIVVTISVLVLSYPIANAGKAVYSDNASV